MSHDVLIVFLVCCGFILFLLELCVIDQVGDELFNYWFKAIKRNIAQKRKKGKLPTDFIKVKRAERTIIRPHTSFDPHTNKLTNSHNGYNYTITVYDQNDELLTMNISEPTWNLLVEYTKSSPTDTLLFINAIFDANSFTQMLIKGIDIQLSNITKGE